MARYFPLFVSLEGKKILVVGAGVIAERRIRSLLPFGAELTVVAPQISEGIQAMSGLTLRQRFFEDADLDGMDMAIIATNQCEENERIAELCAQRGIMKNICSNQTKCDFFFPALVLTPEITVGVCSDGRDPSRTKASRKRIQELLNDEN